MKAFQQTESHPSRRSTALPPAVLLLAALLLSVLLRAAQLLVSPFPVHRRLCALLLAAGLALGAPGAGAQAPAFSLEKLEAAAIGEGQLNLYSSLPPLNTQRFIAGFEKKYPKLKVSFITLISGTMFSRYTAEAESGVKQVDLMLSGSSALYQQRPELFMPITSRNVPGMSKLAANVKARNEAYMVITVTSHYITYNNKFVSKADLQANLRSWKDIANPFWRGKIALVDPMSTSTVMSWLRTLKGAYGEEWVRELAKNNPRYVDGGSSGVQIGRAHV